MPTVRRRTAATVQADLEQFHDRFMESASMAQFSKKDDPGMWNGLADHTAAFLYLLRSCS